MSSHEVRIKIDPVVVMKKDFEVQIKENNSKVGTLLISKGNIE